MNNRKPYYESDLDFTTNAPSYYEALARFNKALKHLTERVDDVEQRFKDLVLEWLEDGTLAELLEQVLLEDYATYEWVKDFLKDYATEEWVFTILEDYATKEWVSGKLDDYATEKWVSNELDKVYQDIEDIKDMITRNNETVTVGDNGDYYTMNEALQYFDEKLVKPFDARINLLSSYEMDEQVILRNKDFRYLTIESENDIVDVVARNFKECIRINAYPEFEIVPMIYGRNSVMPTLDFKLNYVSADISTEVCIDCNDIVSGLLVDNSTIHIKSGGGFTNFNFIGACGIHGSNIVANHCDFSGNGNREDLVEDRSDQDFHGDGVRMWSSTFTGSYSIAHECGDMGFHFSHGSQGYIDKAEANDCGHHALIVTTGSNCSARECTFEDTIDDNVTSYASSKIDLRGSHCSGAKVNYGVIATRTSEINFENGTANNCGFSGIMGNRGSSIDATNGTSNNNTEHGVECANNSRVDFTNGEAKNNGQDGLHATHGSTIQAREGSTTTITGNGRNGMIAFSGIIYANDSTCSNNGKRNIEATRGGRVVANRSTLNGATDKGVLAYGSKIHINRSTINNSGDVGLEATQGGEITAEECTIDGSGYKGVLAYSSKIHLSNSDVLNTTDRKIEATQGGEIIASGVSTNGSGTDFNVYNAGRIFAPNTTGTSNREPNQMSENGFIIGDSLTKG